MRAIAFVLLFVLTAPPSAAQQAVVVSTCGSLPSQLTPGTLAYPTIDVNGVFCATSGASSFSLPPAEQATPQEEPKP